MTPHPAASPSYPEGVVTAEQREWWDRAKRIVGAVARGELDGPPPIRGAWSGSYKLGRKPGPLAPGAKRGSGG